MCFEKTCCVQRRELGFFIRVGSLIKAPCGGWRSYKKGGLFERSKVSELLEDLKNVTEVPQSFSGARDYVRCTRGGWF